VRAEREFRVRQKLERGRAKTSSELRNLKNLVERVSIFILGTLFTWNLIHFCKVSF